MTADRKPFDRALRAANVVTIAGVLWGVTCTNGHAFETAGTAAGPADQFVVTYEYSESVLVLSDEEPATNTPLSEQRPKIGTDTADAKGWVYLGAKRGEKWRGRHFKWSGELPGTGTLLNVTGTVNIRADYMRYSAATGLSNPAVISVVEPGQKAIVRQLVEASPNHYWAEIDVEQTI